ncbi:MAG: DUF3348 domain-containing protein [Cellvibrionaceae bacterium]|nr:DUF3348 domain-containing protein [Cellvibrionaceae bacterium]
MAQVSLDGSRLVRYLSSLGVSAGPLYGGGFAQRISDLINLQQSIALSGFDAKAEPANFEARPLQFEVLRQKVFEQRRELLNSLLESFAPGQGSVRVQFPGSRIGITKEQLENYDLYTQFYVACQRKIEQKCQHMLSMVRDAASGVSPRLAKLVEVETALGNALASYDKQCLGKNAELLKNCFARHLSAAANSSGEPATHEAEPPAWVQNLAEDMRGLLLAELELRLLPVLGLLDALEEESEGATASAPCHKNIK